MVEAGHDRDLSWVVAPDPFASAARLVSDAIERLGGERVRLAIPGGSAAIVGPLAAAVLLSRGFDFARVMLTWVDERCVPASSRASNRGALRFDSPPGLELPLYLDGELPADAVLRVERALQTSFGGSLDVVVLGLGEDGHSASLFVGRPALQGLVAYVPDSPKPPARRITLTRALLRTARHTFVVAAGPGKRAALERLRARDPALPASGLPNLVVCTDVDLGGNR